MNIQLLLLGAALLVIGFVLGRVTAPKLRSTLVYQPPRPRVSDRGHGTGRIDPQIEAALRAGNKIEAVKLYGKAHGTGLKESKDAIDALGARLSR
jgi:hypothetical protein